MLVFSIEGAAHGCERFGERKDFAADEHVVILGSDRMPKHAFRGDRHLGNQVCPCQSDAVAKPRSAIRLITRFSSLT